MTSRSHFGRGIIRSSSYLVRYYIHNNILTLREFFEKKANFLQSIIDKPSLWTGNELSHKTGCLDGQEWDEWSLKVIDVITDLKGQLPDLDDSVVAFVQGARETFVERFSDEFKDGGDIDKLTDSELALLAVWQIWEQTRFS
ncbi:hypothetical protein FPV67DRAFT_1708673 [Lyophyllum atratum]|nr:hypothetical protein FPV67DRAFT_1708673 [Lyophyllum atratum]